MNAKPMSLTHPITKQVYTLTDTGLVEVHDPTTGQRGLFDSEGRWQSGEIRHADLQITGWVGRRARPRDGKTPP
ncbi:hypothetical protein [Frankia sp. CIT1]|uniref:hypothetical protein n=1 Tax=Frankia sp. CIT1 TaxID=2880974 RepID=UPI001EF67905|nr:hypothetical protein [Frankia sp. CIT1]